MKQTTIFWLITSAIAMSDESEYETEPEVFDLYKKKYQLLLDRCEILQQVCFGFNNCLHLSLLIFASCLSQVPCFHFWMIFTGQWATSLSNSTSEKTIEADKKREKVSFEVMFETILNVSVSLHSKRKKQKKWFLETLPVKICNTNCRFILVWHTANLFILMFIINDIIADF